MANTKVPSELIADNSVGITQLNVSDGTNGQVLTTNGSGTLSFSTISGYTDSDVESYLDTGTSTPTFSTATVTGDLTVDTDTLYVDSTNNKVGIGTTSPSRKFVVKDTTTAHIKLTESGLGESVTNGLDMVIDYTGTGYLINRESASLHLGTSNTNRLSIDSSGKIGIGTSIPAYKLTIEENGNNFLHFRQTGDSVAGSLIGRSSSKNLRIQNSENAATEFWTNNTERMRILSSGGITFNGDTAAANALDDYEEGTWTPSMYSLTTNYSATYTKIGRLVYIQCYIDVGSTANTSILAELNTLPFTANNGSNLFHSLTHWSDNKAYDFMFLIQPNTSHIQFRKISNGNNANLAEVSSSGYIISGFYITA